MPRSIITYDGLPISSGGAHSLGKLSPTSTWSSIDRFITRCTAPLSDINFSVEVLEGSDIPEEFSKRMRKNIKQILGRHSHAQNNGFAKAFSWELPKNRLSEVLDLFDASCPFPKHKYSVKIATLYISSTFHLLDRSGTHVLKHQGRENYLNYDTDYERFLGESMLLGSISSNSSLNIFLSLPFEEITEDFQSNIHFLQDNLPFKFSPIQWKRWHVNKAKTGYVGRKITGVVP